MPLQTNYEVHVQQAGRWSIHAQFASQEKDIAIEEAKKVDSFGNIGAVKVIREVYDSTEGTHRNYIIYKSQGVGSEDGETDRTDTKTNDRNGWDDDDDEEEEEFYGDADDDDFSLAPVKKRGKKKTSSLTAITVKILLIILFSVCLAAVTAIVASNLFHGARTFGMRTEAVLMIIFIFTFLFAAGSMAMAFMRGETINTKPRRRRQKAAKAAKSAPAGGSGGERKKKKARAARDELDRAMDGSDQFKLAESKEDHDANSRLQEDIGGDDNAAGEAENQGRGVVLDADSVGAAAEPLSTLSPHAEKQKAYMMDFLSEALDKTGGDNKKLDNFNKFGVNLFLAGACETLADKRDLDGQSRSKVLADSVRVMGFKKSHATTFSDKYEEYLLQDPRYMQMYQAGRNAMNTHFQDPDASPQHMEAALKEWNQPKKKVEETGPITVLFTDIAGSTAMTQQLGDAGAQKVVRAHNRIVRTALTDNNGREVKHTGDGIMASFGKITDGVDASIQMQRETMIYNQQTPDLPLHLKIGINAGEPIVEDNDLFGTVVQLSARIVDKAQADEIYVSEVVRSICVGKAYKFDSKGGFAMKGFDGDLTLYELIWRDQAVAAE